MIWCERFHFEIVFQMGSVVEMMVSSYGIDAYKRITEQETTYSIGRPTMHVGCLFPWVSSIKEERMTGVVYRLGCIGVSHRVLV